MTTADTWRAIGAAALITLGVGLAWCLLMWAWLVAAPAVF